MTEEITSTLAKRGSTYGDFREQGRVAQNLKKAMQDSPNWHVLPLYIKEGLDMVQHKVSRVLNGDCLYDDNFHDIVGYAKLMQDRAAQDRDAGVVIPSPGDPVYPTYEHTSRIKPMVPALSSSDGGLMDLTNEARMGRELLHGLRRIINLTDMSDSDKIAKLKDLMGDV